MSARIQGMANLYTGESEAMWSEAPEARNEHRARRVAFALSHIKHCYHFEGPGLGDFLADFMHLCDALGADFDEVLRNAHFHHTAERNGEP